MNNTFWKQPAKGYTEETRGRTEEEICKREKQMGYKYPNSYRELMKLQNGGALRKSAFYYDGACRSLLYNGAIIEPIPHPYYLTMEEVLEEGGDDLHSLSPSKFIDYKRLVLITGMDGHSWMCFDYGWNEKDAKVEPEICFFNQNYKEYLRISSFDDFVNGLVYYGYESCTYFFGINSNQPIAQFVDEIGRSLHVKFKEHTDDRYGWYNFEKWYSGKIEVESNLDFSIRISPNQFLSKTYLFQDYPALEYVISIVPKENTYTNIENNSAKYNKMMRSLLSDFNKSQVIELLIPENIKNE